MLKKHTRLSFFHSIIDLLQRDATPFHKRKGLLTLCVCFSLLSFFSPFSEKAFAELHSGLSKKETSRRKLHSSRKKERSFPIIERNHAILEDTSRYSIHVEYPSIGFLHTDADIANWARQLVNFFIAGLSQVPKDDPTHFSLYVKYKRIQPSLRVTSFIFYTTTETGNTSPEHGIVTLSYKNQEGRRIFLEELFENKKGLFTFLSNYTRSQLSLRNIENSDYQKRLHGTLPDPINFSLFALTQDGLTIYFAPNQVASPVEGTISVDIPLKKLLQFKPDLALWGKPPLVHKREK